MSGLCFSSCCYTAFVISQQLEALPLCLSSCLDLGYQPLPFSLLQIHTSSPEAAVVLSWGSGEKARDPWCLASRKWSLSLSQVLGKAKSPGKSRASAPLGQGV